MREGKEPKKQPTSDYYEGYYWGNEPYNSRDLSGRRTDEELKASILENLGKSTEFDSSAIKVSVINATATLSGTVRTYEERRLVGKEVWSTAGVIKVLNELEVHDPETAGPGKLS
jgi:osmotically-inducible protein OsmY